MQKAQWVRVESIKFHFAFYRSLVSCILITKTFLSESSPRLYVIDEVAEYPKEYL